VKILDFGLAKLTESSSDESEAEATRAADTQPGLVLGTMGYMAPEQVRGLPVDHRADLFAFGAVLYEMLSGHRAFPGDTPADSMTAILEKDPADLAQADRHISPALSRLVDRCLEKTPAARFQSHARPWRLRSTRRSRHPASRTRAVTRPQGRARSYRWHLVAAGLLVATLASPAGAAAPCVRHP
jgi:serine/threonine protein kinase